VSVIGRDGAALADEVIDFWFRELGESGWFARSERIDAPIRARFLDLHDRLAAADDFESDDPRQLLAAILVLDQFSRNIYRGTPRAYASDSLARRLARKVVDLDLDLPMTREERMFVYLPFEHSEDRDDQALAVRLIGQLGNEHWTRYAVAHQRIIERFGRFPHRNEILGRTSSAEELALLQEPMGSF
jgi:uncharacterized protein (DUF924 family)